MTIMISGALLAAKILGDLARDVRHFRKHYGRFPGLAIVQVGPTAAGDAFVRRKARACLGTGIITLEYRLSSSTSQRALLALIQQLNEDRSIHGILIYLPLPVHLDPEVILAAVDPHKDVDGNHPLSFGRSAHGVGGFMPCMPQACMRLIDHIVDGLRGENVLLVDDETRIGKSLAMHLLARGCDITVAHSKAAWLRETAQRADIIVAVSGTPSMIRGDWIKPGAIVIDAGTVQSLPGTERIAATGHCAISEMEHAAAVTPMQGGLGPIAIACLLSNTLEAARRTNHE